MRGGVWSEIWGEEIWEMSRNASWRWIGAQPYRRGRGSWSAVGGRSRQRLRPEGGNEVKVRQRVLPWGGMKGWGHVLGRCSWEDRGGAECRVFRLKTSYLRAQVMSWSLATWQRYDHISHGGRTVMENGLDEPEDNSTVQEVSQPTRQRPQSGPSL